MSTLLVRRHDGRRRSGVTELATAGFTARL
jgi:hypothetical protein